MSGRGPRWTRGQSAGSAVTLEAVPLPHPNVSCSTLVCPPLLLQPQMVTEATGKGIGMVPTTNLSQGAQQRK
jgi:hypothetical protein